MNTRLKQLKNLWWLQGIFILIMTVACFFWKGSHAGVSALLGALVYTVPNSFFAFFVLKQRGARAAKRIVHAFYKAEALKIILTVLLFATIFILVNVMPGIFFAAYLVMLMTHWFTPWVVAHQQKQVIK